MKGIHNLTADLDGPQASVLTDRERALWVADLDAHGTFCACGEQATDVEVEEQIAHIYDATEPDPFVCTRCTDAEAPLVCDDCGWTGHEPSNCPRKVGR